MKRLTANVISLNTGKPRSLTGLGKTVDTAIVKAPVNKPVFLATEQLEGDEQADKVNHGGPDKAVCVYPFDHYLYWEEELGMKIQPGAFGENVTVKGLVEEAVYIGDVFQWGEAQVQAAQPRVPCHKLARRFNIKDLPEKVIGTGYTGFYFRVVKEGTVSENDPIQFIKRHSDMSVSAVNELFYRGGSDDAIRRLIELPELAESWRTKMANKLKAN